MKLSKKRMLLIAFAAILMFIAAIYLTSYNDIAQSTADAPSPNSLENPEGFLFAVPESPVGTLGMIGALAAAFVMFTIIMKKRRYV
jgi:hypothetical protein